MASWAQNKVENANGGGLTEPECPEKLKQFIESLSRERPHEAYIFLELIQCLDSYTQYKGALQHQKQLFESEHQRNLAQQKKMELLLSQIIDGDPVPTFVLDANHRVIHWNQACAVISGYSCREMLGTTQQWRAFYPAERPVMADLIINGSLEAQLDTYYKGIFRRSKAIAGAFEAEAFFPLWGENGRWLFFTAAPLRDEEGHLIGAIETLQDVTERHCAEDELRRYQNQLEEQVLQRTSELAASNAILEEDRRELELLLSKVEEAQQQVLQSEKMASIGQLAAGVAHEINNPIGFVSSNLTSLKGYLEQLFTLIDAYESQNSNLIEQARSKADLEFLREDIPALLADSKDGLKRVSTIVQELKDFSRIDHVGWQSADLNAALEGTLKVVWHELKYKADVQSELGSIPEVYCSPAQINQVFMNLLVNAAQSIDQHGIIYVRSGVNNSHVWFEIEDTGQGMSEDVRRRIFEPFFTTKSVGKGTGLGLSISYDIIVKKHAGLLAVTSQLGKGSCFRIMLPLTVPA